MKKSGILSLLIPFLWILCSFAQAQEARLLRQPTVSSSSVAFVYADDIWIVPRSGRRSAPVDHISRDGNISGFFA